MCCMTLVQRTGVNVAFPEEALDLLMRCSQHSSDDSSSASIAFTATRGAAAHGGHLASYTGLMLKQAIGFAMRCHEMGLTDVYIVQLEDPCGPHESEYPFPLTDFCTEAMKWTDRGGTQ